MNLLASIWHQLKIYFAWRTVGANISYIYRINIITGERRAYRKESRSYQPADTGWLDGDDRPVNGAFTNRYLSSEDGPFRPTSPPPPPKK